MACRTGSFQTPSMEDRVGLTLSTTDLARLHDTTQVLLSPGEYDDPDAWGTAVLRQVEALFNADRSLLFLPAPDGLMLVTESVPSEMVPAFHSTFSRIEEGRLRSDRPDVDSVLAARTAARMDVFTNQRLLALTAESPEMVPWYHDVIVPSGVRHGSGVALSLPAGEAWLCVAHSSPADDPFGVEAGLELLRLLLPAFRAGVEQLVHQGRSGQGLIQSLDQLGHAFLAFDLDGREMVRSRVLDLALAGDPHGPEVLARAGQMAAAMIRLRRGAGLAQSASPTPAAYRDVITPAGLYRLRCAFLPAGALEPDETIMVAVDPPPPQLPSADELRRRFGLTAREAETTLLLATGASNKQIAAALAISPHTVRTHAERIFRKLGVNSRKALGLKLLTGFPESDTL
jgi:DNA-binding CsgD family transcriptional regulator